MGRKGRSQAFSDAELAKKGLGRSNDSNTCHVLDERGELVDKKSYLDRECEISLPQEQQLNWDEEGEQEAVSRH